MSDTPQTDREEARMRDAGCPGVICADFVKGLERELRQACEERDAALTTLNKIETEARLIAERDRFIATT